MNDAVSPSLGEIISEYVPGEEVVAAEMFQKSGTWAVTAGGGFLSKLFGRGGEEGPKGPEKFNALILTRERLHLIGVKSKSGRWVVTEPVGSWDVDDLVSSARQEHTHMPRTGREPIRTVETIQLSIDIKSENRNLALEGTLWGEESKAQETTDALLAATGGQWS